MILSLPQSALFNSLSHTSSFCFTLFCYNKDSLTEHSSDRGVSIWQAVATKWNVQMRNRERERKKSQGSSSEQCHFLDDKAAVLKARNAMQLMPVTGVTMLANYPQESHCAKARRPPPRSPVRPSAVSSHRARAACAPMAVTMASTRLQGRAPSEPSFEIQREVPLFSSQFHHFWTLSATDDHLDCFNQTFLCPFMQKNLGPLESGTESKKKRLFGLA